MQLNRVAASLGFAGLLLLTSSSLLTGCEAEGSEQAAATLGVAGSRCTIDATGANVSCTHQSITIDGRAVLFQAPLGTPPAGGWPAVFNFQASLFSPNVMWDSSLISITTLFGGPNEVLLIKRLLDAGYAVITPTADLLANAWDTNLPPWSLLWPLAPDNRFLTDLFAAIAHGQLGALSSTRWYAMGASSGGYMTSRMAVSYQTRFKALAVVSGSYATCGGPLCSIPDLPTDHPPTLFLHGGIDPIVPISTMYPYRDKLDSMGIETRVVVDPLFGHGWIAAAPSEVLRWFQSH